MYLVNHKCTGTGTGSTGTVQQAQLCLLLRSLLGFEIDITTYGLPTLVPVGTSGGLRIRGPFHSAFI